MNVLLTIKTAAGVPLSDYPKTIEVRTDSVWDLLATTFFKVSDVKLSPGDTLTATIQSPMSESKTVPK